MGRESLFDGSVLEIKGKEQRYRRDHARLLAKRKAGNWSQEQDRWEANRLLAVGLRKEELDLSLFEGLDNDSRAVIIVKDTAPPFLKGRHIAQITNEEVSVVKDATSDLAMCARKGSAALNRLREETERSKMRERFWELAGTTLGKVLGIQDEKDIEEERAAEEAATARPLSNLGASLMQSAGALPSRDTIKRQQEKLPISRCRDQLMRVIREHPVTIVVGETGSGKTTQLTQYLYAEGYGRRKRPADRYDHVAETNGDSSSSSDSDSDGAVEASDKAETRRAQKAERRMRRDEASTQAPRARPVQRNVMIGCTQPRRVAAVSVAKRVADEFGCVLGREVGYSIRFEDCTTAGVTRIKYMTDAFLLREILSDPDLEKYDAIVMDEAHERSLSTDVLFGLLKTLIGRRFDLKLIVTSATMNAERFSEFFGHAPIFNIPGRTYPVTIEHMRSVCPDYVDAAVQKCLQIHLSFPFDPESPSDVLIFMTGQEDIEGLCILLSERAATLKEKMSPLSVLPIYSQLPADLQAKVFEKSKYRKVIVATNIAETSLTLEGIKFVIDCGFCKLKVFSPRIGMDTLQLTPISRANANQRSGRAGRTAPGICYRLYTERAYVSEMFATQVPEIQRTNLAHVVLLLKSLNVKDLVAFDYMDAPPSETILNAMTQLWMLGALDDRGDLTALGAKMAHLPVDPSLAKMILLSNQLQCSSELLTVVAMLSVSSIFYRPKGRAEEADASREKFAVPESDHLTLLNVFQQWTNNRNSPVWAAKHFIHQKALTKVRSVREQLNEIIRTQRIEPISCGQEWTVIRKAVSSGYFHHAAKLRGLGEYINLQTSLPCHLHPSSSLFLSGLAPEYVVYHEVMMTTKEYMQNVSDSLFLVF